MKYCQSCGLEIKSETKFCTHCGAPVGIPETPQKVEIKEKIKQPSSVLKKAIIGLIIVVGLFVLTKTFIPEFDDFISSNFASKELSRLEGKWHDSTGELLGNEQELIILKKKGDAVIGEDKNKRIYIQLLHYSGNNYAGFVVLNGVDASFEVSYFPDEEKLVFFSTLTKTSWNIRRLK